MAHKCGRDIVQVKLNVPATSAAAPTTDTFVAVGIGVLVTEDWSSQGSLQLFRLVREKTLGFDGELVARWALVDTYRREFTGPVTALSTSSGNLVAAFGHNVRFRALDDAGPFQRRPMFLPHFLCLRGFRVRSASTMLSAGHLSFSLLLPLA